MFLKFKFSIADLRHSPGNHVEAEFCSGDMDGGQCPLAVKSLTLALPSQSPVCTEHLVCFLSLNPSQSYDADIGVITTYHAVYLVGEGVSLELQSIIHAYTHFKGRLFEIYILHPR